MNPVVTETPEQVDLACLLEEEVQCIHDDDLQKLTRHLLRVAVPGYFWYIPASSSGKYHPRQSLGEAGLLRHTKMAARFFTDSLVRPYLHGGVLTQKQADLGLAALILHDTFKRAENGKQQYCKEHGAIAARVLFNAAKQYLADHPSQTLTVEDLKVLACCIGYHMGPWTVIKGAEPKPFGEFTLLEQLVHLGDIMAANRDIVLTSIEDPTAASIG